MDLAKFRSEVTGSNIQCVIFNLKGEILESDDSLVNLSATSFNVFSDTIFCGMEEAFEQLSVSDELEFNCIEIDIAGKNSHYDFFVKRIPDDENGLRFGWVIYDSSKQYQKVFELQQERNIAEIQFNKIERQASKLKEEKIAIERLFSELQNDSLSQYILVKSDNLLINLNLEETLYFEAYGDYVKVNTPSKMYITYTTLRSVEDSLPASQFFRIHRSYIIRLDKVKNIEQLSVQIEDKVLPIGKSHKSALIEKIGQL